MHLFNKFFALLVFGSLFDCVLAENLKDKFVFKLGGEVFAVSDVKEYDTYLRDLECIYPDSLIVKVFKSEFSGLDSKAFEIKNQFTKYQKEKYLALRGFGKLLVYSKSYDVSINEQLTKYFFLSAKQGNCETSVFDKDKNFIPKFKELVHLEVFTRKRFLPSETEGKTTPADISKAILGAKSLIKSIDPQIEEEVYW